VSSQALGARARAGRSLRYLVPDAVARYAERHRLYPPGAVVPP
jgi:nicotinic acid mononucleotide adenylyltransferase